jgi:pimeloyl-ACP methyl ester carboxylesterase
MPDAMPPRGRPARTHRRAHREVQSEHVVLDAPSSAVPTVVLAHGAFADASSWSGVIVELQSRGIPVLAPPNPLRGLDGDAAYIAERVMQIDGPVLLVGHAYGGAVITVAAAAARNVVGLFYVAAFIPDEGEVLAEIAASFPEPRLAEVLRQNAFPLDGTGEIAVELSIAPA